MIDETLYALVKRNVRRDPRATTRTNCLLYRLAPSVKDLWGAMDEEQPLGTGCDAEYMRRLGYHTVKLLVTEVTEAPEVKKAKRRTR